MAVRPALSLPSSALLPCFTTMPKYSFAQSLPIWIREPSVFSIDDLAREGTTAWEGVRNYVASALGLRFKLVKKGGR